VCLKTAVERQRSSDSRRNETFSLISRIRRRSASTIPSAILSVPAMPGVPAIPTVPSRLNISSPLSLLFSHTFYDGWYGWYGGYVRCVTESATSVDKLAAFCMQVAIAVMVSCVGTQHAFGSPRHMRPMCRWCCVNALSTSVCEKLLLGVRPAEESADGRCCLLATELAVVRTRRVTCVESD